MTNWYKSTMSYAIKLSNEAMNGYDKSRYNEMISQLLPEYQKAKNEIDLDYVSNEITGLYNCVFEFKKSRIEFRINSKDVK
jgi:hypothetical protein